MYAEEEEDVLPTLTTMARTSSSSSAAPRTPAKKWPVVIPSQSPDEEEASSTQETEYSKTRGAAKRKSGSLFLTERQEIELAEWVKENKIFYNKKSVVYRDTHQRNTLLAEKSKEMKCLRK